MRGCYCCWSREEKERNSEDDYRSDSRARSPRSFTVRSARRAIRPPRLAAQLTCRWPLLCGCCLLHLLLLLLLWLFFLRLDAVAHTGAASPLLALPSMADSYDSTHSARLEAMLLGMI